MSQLPLRVQELLNQLSNVDMAPVLFDDAGRSIQLRFVRGEGRHDVILNLANLVYFQYSRVLDDDVEASFVGHVTLEPLTHGGVEILTERGYGFRTDSGKVKDYDRRQLFSFHLEGAVVIHAVCGAYELFEQVTM